MVQSAQQMHPEAGAVVRHHVRLRNAAGHQPRIGAGFGAVRVEPVQGLFGVQLPPACRQGGGDGGKLIGGGRLKAGQHPDRREDVQRPVFTTGVQTTPPVEHALGIGGHAHRGDGIE